MKLSAFVTAALATVAFGVPALDKRQGCSVGFVFARGSAEPAPLGMIVGPQLQSALKAKISGLQTFPVGYAASLATNISPQRTDATSIKQGVDAFKKASNCRSIVAGGYSQGAAVMHNSVRALDASLKAKIAGVALFGDTLNKQENGHINGFPQEKSKVWCNSGDGVCGGGLNVNAGHMSYTSSISAAATWLQGRVKAHGGSGGSSESGESSGAKGLKGSKGGSGKGFKGGAGGGSKGGADGSKGGSGGAKGAKGAKGAESAESGSKEE